MSAWVRRPLGLAAILVAASTPVAMAPQPAASAPPGSAAFAPDVGATAPGFSHPGSTRYGLLKNPIKLSDFRGQTVVLAFFPKARTKG